MSLTDDWKAGKLKEDWYFIKFDDVIYQDYYNGYFIQTGDTDGIEVLAPCDYGELQRLKSENAELIETNGSLSRQVKHLLDLQKEEDKEVERLRDLLKECKEHICFHFCEKKARKLLTRINAAIGESEE